jgi:hypothetical protein
MKVGLSASVPSEWVDPGGSKSTASGVQRGKAMPRSFPPLYQIVSGATMMLYLATTAGFMAEVKTDS